METEKIALVELFRHFQSEADILRQGLQIPNHTKAIHLTG